MTVSDQEIVFHTHPRNSEFADLPSPYDLFWFVMGSALRSIIIGNKKINVMDKTPKFLCLLDEIADWMANELTDFMLGQSKDASNCKVVDAVHDYISNRFLKIDLGAKQDWIEKWRQYLENLGIAVAETERSVKSDSVGA